MESTNLVQLPNPRPRQLEEAVTAFRHRITDSGLFTDESLVRILDGHPSEFLAVSRMGSDCRKYEWSEGDLTGLGGAELLTAVRKGRLWLNVRKVTRFWPELNRLVERLYSELEQRCPEFRTSRHSANILISSPKALVYYHLDLPQNILWQVRGHKRIWVYPINERTVSSEVLESTLASERLEDLPYDPDTDAMAEVFDLASGDVVTWPQNCPHRVENAGDLNISLSTEHYTAAQLRRIRVAQANSAIRKATGLTSRSVRTDGLGYAMKYGVLLASRTSQRWIRRRQDHKLIEYPRTFRVNPSAADGVEPLDAPVAGTVGY